MKWTPSRLRFRNRCIALVPWAFVTFLRARFAFQTLARWMRTGWELPLPNVLKHPILVRYARDHRLTVLIETGTFLGDTPWALRHLFQEIRTIELSSDLALAAEQRFKPFPHIHVHRGNSATILPTLVESLHQPALFWLDGHFSGGITAGIANPSPIRDEIRVIITKCPVRFVILIDDARAFGSDPAYPSLDELQRMVAELLPGADFTMSNDMIAIVPNGSRCPSGSPS